MNRPSYTHATYVFAVVACLIFLASAHIASAASKLHATSTRSTSVTDVVHLNKGTFHNRIASSTRSFASSSEALTLEMILHGRGHATSTKSYQKWQQTEKGFMKQFELTLKSKKTATTTPSRHGHL